MSVFARSRTARLGRFVAEFDAGACLAWVRIPALGNLIQVKRTEDV